MFKIKFIKNPPTVDNLKSLYESETYQNLLKEYSKQAKYKLDTRPDDNMSIFNMLTNIQKRYLILNIPFEEVLTEIEQKKKDLLKYSFLRINFFNDSDDDCPDGEFPQGEEPDEDNKSVLIKSFGVSKTFFLGIFCEFYLLNTRDKERLLHFLKTTRMPQAKKFAGQIAKLYKQAMTKD